LAVGIPFGVGFVELHVRKEREAMKVRNSLKSLKGKDGAVVVRRGGRAVVVNKKHPRWKVRQG
jgi:large subunit ribosomal protein L36